MLCERTDLLNVTSTYRVHAKCTKRMMLWPGHKAFYMFVYIKFDNLSGNKSHMTLVHVVLFNVGKLLHANNPMILD